MRNCRGRPQLMRFSHTYTITYCTLTALIFSYSLSFLTAIGIAIVNIIILRGFSFSVRATPSWLKANGQSTFFFEGDCNDPNTQAKIRDDYWNFLRNPQYIPPPFCLINQHCQKDKIVIYCGATSAADKRRRRAGTREVNIRFEYVNKDTGLKQQVDDQNSQNAYNAKKQEVQTDVIDETAKKLENPTAWNEFKVTSGLELKDPYRLENADAYCSEDGAVVRKCESWDVNWATGEYKCNKPSGSVTKCSKCYRLAIPKYVLATSLLLLNAGRNGHVEF